MTTRLRLVPAIVREMRPTCASAGSTTSRIPSRELFAQAPWRGLLLEGLLGADFLGFQRVYDCPQLHADLSTGSSV